MFRTALRTAAARRAAAAVVPAAAGRGLSSMSMASRPSLAAAKKPASAAWAGVSKMVAVRGYASGGGLSKPDVEGRIMSLLAGFDKVKDPSNIKPNAHFANDLGMDSLDTVEVVMAIEEEFSIEIPDKDADTIHSVDKAVEYILSQPDAH